jgi:hypothetical protein
MEQIWPSNTSTFGAHQPPRRVSPKWLFGFRTRGRFGARGLPGPAQGLTPPSEQVAEVCRWRAPQPGRALPGPAGGADRSPARNRLEPKPPCPPAPSRGGDLAQNGARPRAHPAVNKIRDLVFEALTEVTAGGSSAANQLVGCRRVCPGFDAQLLCQQKTRPLRALDSTSWLLPKALTRPWSLESEARGLPSSQIGAGIMRHTCADFGA